MKARAASGIGLVLWISAWLEASSQPAVLYQNDFSSGNSSLASLTTFNTGEFNAAAETVEVSDGQLVVTSTSVAPVGAILDTAFFGNGYSTTLSASSGAVSWAFNVSNMDGRLNNGFAIALAYQWTDVGSGIPPDPFSDTSVGYILKGGGLLGGQLQLSRFDVTAGGKQETLIDVPSELGLGTLPMKGSIRVTYEPATDAWSLFMQTGNHYVDPMGLLPLLGTAVDGTYTHDPTPYFSLIGDGYGVDYFDDLTIAVVPEPSVPWLLGLALLALRRPFNVALSALLSEEDGPGEADAVADV